MQARIVALDKLRGVAILSVLVIHALIHCLEFVQGGLISGYLYAALSLFGRIGVPVFIVLSGFFFTHDELRGQSGKYIAKRRVKRVLPPYLIWSAVYFWSGYLLATEVFNRPPLVIFFEKLLTGTVGWQMYFVVLIVQYYYIGMLGVFANGFIKRHELVLAVFFNIIFIIASYMAMLNPDFELLRMFSAYRLSLFPVYICYFMIGRWAGANYKEILKNLKRYPNIVAFLVVITFVLALGEFRLLYLVSAGQLKYPMDWMVSTNLFVCAAMSGLFLLFELKYKQSVNFLFTLAKYSFPIYILHEPMLGLVTKLSAYLLSGMYGFSLLLPAFSISIVILIVVAISAAFKMVLSNRAYSVFFG